MADSMKETSTPNYTVGYGEAMQQWIITRHSATADAAYLLPFLKPGMRVLDVGCGPGTLSVGLASAVDPGEFYGVDMEESQVELAATAAREGGHSNAHFQVADATNLPFLDDHFDVVHCHNVLMHIPDTMAVLAQIKRVLKTGGIVGAQDPIADSFFIEPDIGNLSKFPATYSAVHIANGGHPQMGKELRVRLSEAGFVDIEAHASLTSYSSPSDIAFFAGELINVFLAPPFAGQVISHGIATQEEFDEWREAAVVWKDHPGAFAALAHGEAIGRKP